MFIPIAKILKGKRIEKFCLLFIYISIFSCLAVYNKDHFTKYETVFEENENVSMVPLTVEDEMISRLKVLSHACKAHGLDQPGNDSLHRPYPWEYLINEEHHLVWCNIFKSGSTSWLNIFNKLKKPSGPSRIPPVALARRSYVRPSVEQLRDAINKSVTFIVGRNPLERLVSGYRDKILNAFKGSEHDVLRKVIVQRFRPNQQQNVRSSKMETPTPTFSEFVQFVINEDLNDRMMDMHWEPVYKFCTPCQFKFTHIVKMETFDRDQEVILEKVGLRNVVGLHKDNVGKGGQTSEDLTKKYLQELPPKLYNHLVKIYQIDLDLFGYKAPTFN